MYSLAKRLTTVAYLIRKECFWESISPCIWLPSLLWLVYYLTHLPMDKIAAVLTDDNFKCIFWNENDIILIQISLKFVPRSPINNKPDSGKCLALNRLQAISWTNADLIHWRIYASLGGDELKHVSYLHTILFWIILLWLYFTWIWIHAIYLFICFITLSQTLC